MTGLLISVRNAEEAATALAGGVDLLDVKEPASGSLGAASPAIWQDVLDTCRHRVPTSVALGELHQAGDRPDPAVLGQFDYAKVGLADCGRRSDWQHRWMERLDALPTSVSPVAVVYADWQQCGAPVPQQIIRQAADSRCGVVLFDTYVKSGADLFAHIPPAELRRMIAVI
ncbi:MAG: (5-formylfuran-3-yl)methyl phosphate synthase, partial [Planctomycetes bacterium]|nr:(5-formylfuran-3-yl)methyl phosphate synthase [Planctomycetota bacterium]